MGYKIKVLQHFNFHRFSKWDQKWDQINNIHAILRLKKGKIPSPC